MSREEDLRRLLHDAATEIPAGNAPIAELVREGRRSKKLRHIVQAASVAAAVAVIAVGAFILGPSLGGSGNLATQPNSPQGSQATRSDPTESVAPSKASASTSPAVPTPRPSKPAYTITFSKGIGLDERRVVRNFVRFAVRPTPRTAAAVNFAPSGLLLRMGSAPERTLSPSAAKRPKSWLLNDGEGSSSALFVLSNTVRRAEGMANTVHKAAFLAAASNPPSCDLPPTGPATTSRVIRLFTTDGRRVDCSLSTGFRIELNLDGRGRISAVFLSITAP